MMPTSHAAERLEAALALVADCVRGGLIRLESAAVHVARENGATDAQIATARESGTTPAVHR